MRSAIVLSWALLALRPAWADDAAAWAALRSADAVVALMRHTDAPGAGDPPGWRLDDCATQRNLSDQGRTDARAIGARLKAQRIRIAKVISSPWCRCLDTARLMNVGAVLIEPTFANALMLSDRRAELTEGARTLIGRWRGPGVLLVVTHGANIQALTGRSPSPGEIVVVTMSADGALQDRGSLVIAPAPR
ncbi:MAG TPA: histidine phosphatase family protein [Albitalea sp.]|uniref:histidine phosphatase family protein n=1 Tax=Piscinibacter sp. TaxID=1903157 RepID=UPI002ED481F2